MRKFSIKILEDLSFYYNHYLSYEFINEEKLDYSNYFKEGYLRYSSRRFDKPAVKQKDGTYVWCLDNKIHREGKPAWIYSNGYVLYYENGKIVK